MQLNNIDIVGIIITDQNGFIVYNNSILKGDLKDSMRYVFPVHLGTYLYTFELYYINKLEVKK